MEDSTRVSQMPPDQLPAPIETGYYPPQPPGPQPMTPAPLPPEGPKPTNVRQDMSSPASVAFLILCLVGIVIITIGAIYGATGSFSSVDWDQRKDIVVYGRMVMLMGAALLSTGLLAAGLIAKDLSPRNRSTLVIVSVVIVILFLLWPIV